MTESGATEKYLYSATLRYLKRASANEVARRGVTVFLVQVLGVAVAFAAQILIARLIGKEQYGIHATVLSWMAVLLLPAVFGIDTMTLRFFLRTRPQTIIQKLLVWCVFHKYSCLE